MKKISFFTALIFLVLLSSVYAQQKSKETSGKAADSVSRNSSVGPDSANPSSGVPSFPAQGMMMAAGTTQEMVPIVREATSSLKELLAVIKSAGLEEENADAVDKAKGVIKKGEEAVEKFVNIIGSQPADYGKSQSGQQTQQQKKKSE